MAIGILEELNANVENLIERLDTVIEKLETINERLVSSSIDENEDEELAIEEVERHLKEAATKRRGRGPGRKLKLANVKDAIKEVVAKFGMAKGHEVIRLFNVSSIGDLNPSEYAAFILVCNKTLEKQSILDGTD